MPKRTDIDSILIIGAGPIVIGQACEFDYSGVQACKALKDEGYRVVLVNSNPATIMTDPGLADATYIEPITPAMTRVILERERAARPDERMALLPTMGGQTALNVALALERDGTLRRLNVELVGARADAIDKAEDRLRFREAMRDIGLDSPRSRLVRSLPEALAALEEVGLPAIIRPSFTLSGAGGGVADTREAFERIVLAGLRASPIGSALVEESLLGWKEFEMEVVRDRNDNCIIVCAIENIDPMGVHTGDSITVAPALTLTDKEYQIMRDASIAVLREIGVETGGSNVQFAVDPKTGRLVVIEMNPRVSRSSALASKATGFPIAKVAARLAVGYTLDEIQNDVTGVTPASFEPTLDYVVTKIPRFAFEKFPGADAALTTAMKSVGEVMAIGRCFAESLQKALRSLETGLTGLDEMEIDGAVDAAGRVDKTVVAARLQRLDSDRLLKVAQAFRYGLTRREINVATAIDPWFLEQIEALVAVEAEVRGAGLPQDAAALLALKRQGFSDARLATLCGKTEAETRAHREALGVRPVYRRIDTCAAEFPSRTSYLYSCYEIDTLAEPHCEAEPSERRKAIILGSGPNRIGQGIEFDYCCVHASYALAEVGIETIMINCNPETVSTDYDSSDRLYFEPLTAEDVLAVCRKEQERGVLLGVIVQFGGQTPLKLCRALEAAGIPILGTSPDAIDLAEDRDRFQKLLEALALRQPPNGIAMNREQALRIAERIGYPVVIRPSYVLGGRAMEIVRHPKHLERYIDVAVRVSGANPVLIDRYLDDAIEVDVDVISDGVDAFVAGVMEHIEEAGAHSGDSACALPPHSLPEAVVTEMKGQAIAMAKALTVIGLMNVQFAVRDGEVFILEVNPRASRTVPFVAKATGLPAAKIATWVMVGARLSEFALTIAALAPVVAVKEAVLPFGRFPGVDVALGPEMRSTGEAMGIDRDFAIAYAKAQLGAGVDLVSGGRLLVAVRDADRERVLPAVRELAAEGYGVLAPENLAVWLEAQGVTTERCATDAAGLRALSEAFREDSVQLLFSTIDPEEMDRGRLAIRRMALELGVSYYTTIRACCAVAAAVRALRVAPLQAMPLQALLAPEALKPAMTSAARGRPEKRG